MAHCSHVASVEIRLDYFAIARFHGACEPGCGMSVESLRLRRKDRSRCRLGGLAAGVEKDHRAEQRFGMGG